jgi:CheY-like chemotaxis protein
MTPRGKRILVVEDHADTAQLIQRQLEQIGYPISSVAISGPEALQKARHENPDLILMDISLPGMSGFEVAAKLKADALTRAIPILAVTAKAMPGDREACLRSGCNGYLAKPFFPQQLKAEIEKLLAPANT